MELQHQCMKRWCDMYYTLSVIVIHVCLWASCCVMLYTRHVWCLWDTLELSDGVVNDIYRKPTHTILPAFIDMFSVVASWLMSWIKKKRYYQLSCCCLLILRGCKTLYIDNKFNRVWLISLAGLLITICSVVDIKASTIFCFVEKSIELFTYIKLVYQVLTQRNTTCIYRKKMRHTVIRE